MAGAAPDKVNGEPQETDRGGESAVYDSRDGELRVGVRLDRDTAGHAECSRQPDTPEI